MMRFITLVLLGCFFSLSRADEFNLNFSKDIIDAAGGRQNEFDALPLTNPEVQNSPVSPPILKEQPIESKAPPDLDAIEKKPESQVVRGKPYVKGVKPTPPEQDFSPVQGASASSLLVPNALAKYPVPGFYPADALQMNPNASDPFDQIHDELRLLVGEDVYARMVWTYLDIKQFDNWLYATMEQYTLFAEESLLVGLNDQLMITLGLSGPNSQHTKVSVRSSGSAAELGAAEAEIKNAILRADLEAQSRFFTLLKYFTVRNFFYVMLIGLVLTYTGKAFKFLVRQQ